MLFSSFAWLQFQCAFFMYCACYNTAVHWTSSDRQSESQVPNFMTTVPSASVELHQLAMMEDRMYALFFVNEIQTCQLSQNIFFYLALWIIFLFLAALESLDQKLNWSNSISLIRHQCRLIVRCKSKLLFYGTQISV